MVMIPTDVGIQVRNQTEPGLGPVRAVADISADLPELGPGQVFRARIQEVLPENTYRALVAGKSLTLSLQEGAKAGDTLELVVVDRTPRAIVARLAGQGAEAAGEPYQQATLSRTGQLIASLLAREGETAFRASLTRGRPLLPLAPASSAELAQRLPSQLAQAVATSGLFYEAHQVEWALGQRTMMSLLAEPQGQHSRAEVLAAGGQDNGTLRSAILAQLAAGADTQATRPAPVSLLRALFGGEIAAATVSAEETSPAPSQSAAGMIPEELRPLVQQQLEAGATQRLAWHGEIWPKQFLEWEIERDAAHAESAAAETAVWLTTLRLQLPRLGEVEARIRLSGQTLELVLRATDPASAADLQSAVPGLQHALAAAGLALAAVQAQARHDEG